ncbi:hypothetical protein L484_006005 [Morus notabilis]|uniref:Uncharacterized protein n=1 Tax=Morus notabilis TaxID=981085 RepID=W9RES0_9ROSA|nr:hypothetical protein L484_006005 [Morus notabilis]
MTAIEGGVTSSRDALQFSRSLPPVPPISFVPAKGVNGKYYSEIKDDNFTKFLDESSEIEEDLL